MSFLQECVSVFFENPKRRKETIHFLSQKFVLKAVKEFEKQIELLTDGDNLGTSSTIGKRETERIKKERNKTQPQHSIPQDKRPVQILEAEIVEQKEDA